MPADNVAHQFAPVSGSMGSSSSVDPRYRLIVKSRASEDGNRASSHRPIGAYDILDELKRRGRKAAPPTVYRALDFLIDAGLAHRLDSLNAFVGCPDPQASHSGQFLICRRCRSVAELDDADITGLVEQKADALGFSAIRQVLEIQGLCRHCREREAG